MTLLLLRITLAPLLILAGSVVQRRWGQGIGGRVIGLPLTSLPLLLLLGLSQGPTFTAGAARASLAAGVAQSAWCLVYACAARRRPPLAALLISTAAFAAICVALAFVPLATPVAALASALSILGAMALWPAPGGAVHDAIPAPHDVPVRMAVAALFTMVLTECAASLGARPAGLVGAFPLITVVLAVATHHRDGAAAVHRFLAGVMAGSFSVVAALVVVAEALPHADLGVTFLAAVVASVLAQLAPALRPARPARRGRARAAARWS